MIDKKTEIFKVKPDLFPLLKIAAWVNEMKAKIKIELF